MRPLLTPLGRHWLGYAFWCFLSVTGFYMTFTFHGDIANYRYGAGDWPRALFVLMFIFASLQFLISRHHAKAAARTAPVAAEDEEKDEDDKQGAGYLSLAGLPVRVVIVPVIYVALLVPVGFFVATPPFLAATMVAMGERRPGKILMATLVIYALIILVFIKLLYVPLPVGTWPGFYDIGNWALTTVR